MSTSKRVAISGLMCALCVSFLFFSSVIPTLKLTFLLLSGLIVAATVVLSGITAAFCVYIAASFLSIFLLPTKSVVLLFVLFFGLYSVLMPFFCKLRKIWYRIILKYAYFNIILLLSVYLFTRLFYLQIPSDPVAVAALYIAVNALFAAYDYLLCRLTEYFLSKFCRHF